MCVRRSVCRRHRTPATAVSYRVPDLVRSVDEFRAPAVAQSGPGSISYVVGVSSVPVRLALIRGPVTRIARQRAKPRVITRVRSDKITHFLRSFNSKSIYTTYIRLNIISNDSHCGYLFWVFFYRVSSFPKPSDGMSKNECFPSSGYGSRFDIFVYPCTIARYYLCPRLRYGLPRIS